MPPTKRARNLDELTEIVGKLFNKDSRESGLKFQPSPDDLIISPHSKSGTTWLQQIAHGLRTRGSMDFGEINEVTPWIENAQDLGWELTADQVAHPRIFKSHLNWYAIPKGARYICSFRHPFDVAVSYYRFFEGWLFEPGTISLEELIRWRWIEGKPERSYWFHLTSWWEQRDNEDVLLLCFEDMKLDLAFTIKTIANFMQINLDDELFEIVMNQSSKTFMLAHQHQFDEHHLREQGEKRAGLPPAIDSSKVTAGHNNQEKYQLSKKLKKELDDYWHDLIFQKHGLKNYAELREKVRLLRH